MLPENLSMERPKAFQKFSSIDEENQLMSPSSRWHTQPKSYRGPVPRKLIRKAHSFIDTTDGETSGMGSSVDEPIESSTESASETSASCFLQPRSSIKAPSLSPSTIKKRRGGWPKGRKRKPEVQCAKPPKAPLTAYVLFLNERRKYYKETHPDIPFVEVSKLMGSEWSSMTGDEKDVYITKSEQEKKRYRNELQSYRQSHDYQLQLRKKRIKNTVRRGATTTEESSDFTDEIDDDDSEELYCRTCDQWFISLHNKREHLYGRLHLKAVTGEYQRERKAEELRQKATSEHWEVGSVNDITGLAMSLYDPFDQEDRSSQYYVSVSNETNCDENIIVGQSAAENRVECSVYLETASNYKVAKGESSSAAEDDHNDALNNYSEDEDYDGEGEATEEEGGLDSDRVAGAAEEVLHRVIAREKEIRWLRRRREKSRNYHKKLTSSLLELLNRRETLEEVHSGVTLEECKITEKVDNLEHFIEYWKDPSVVNTVSNCSRTDLGDSCKDVPPRLCAESLVPEHSTISDLKSGALSFRLKTKSLRLKNSSVTEGCKTHKDSLGVFNKFSDNSALSGETLNPQSPPLLLNIVPNSLFSQDFSYVMASNGLETSNASLSSYVETQSLSDLLLSKGTQSVHRKSESLSSIAETAFCKSLFSPPKQHHSPASLSNDCSRVLLSIDDSALLLDQPFLHEDGSLLTDEPLFYASNESRKYLLSQQSASFIANPVGIQKDKIFLPLNNRYSTHVPSQSAKTLLSLKGKVHSNVSQKPTQWQRLMHINDRASCVPSHEPLRASVPKKKFSIFLRKHSDNDQMSKGGVNCPLLLKQINVSSPTFRKEIAKDTRLGTKTDDFGSSVISVLSDKSSSSFTLSNEESCERGNFPKFSSGLENIVITNGVVPNSPSHDDTFGQDKTLPYSDVKLSILDTPFECKDNMVCVDPKPPYSNGVILDIPSTSKGIESTKFSSKGTLHSSLICEEPLFHQFDWDSVNGLKVDDLLSLLEESS